MKSEDVQPITLQARLSGIDYRRPLAELRPEYERLIHETAAAFRWIYEHREELDRWRAQMDRDAACANCGFCLAIGIVSRPWQIQCIRCDHVNQSGPR